MHILKTKPINVETVTSSYQQPEVLRSPFFTGGDAYREASQIRSELSPHCRKILAETGIETTILRSPTANGSYNTDNDISLGLSYQLTDFSKANLKEELALAR